MMPHPLTAMLWFLLAATSVEADDGRPRVTHVATVAPDIVGITIDAGKVIPGRQVPYRKQRGDAVKMQGEHGPILVQRDGKPLGAIVGARQDVVWLYARPAGQHLDAKWADKPDSYRISSTTDGDYMAPAQPTAVHRKSKPIDMGRTGPWNWAFAARHIIYLKLPKPLKTGQTYTITFPGGPLPEWCYLHDPAKVRSEAVHISHIGFRPDDPVKAAFLSCWLGDGGKLDYPDGLAFQILVDRDGTPGEKVFEGKAVVARRAGETEDPYRRNYNLTDVHRLDFSGLTRPGRYRLCVEGIGCSYPFEVAPDVWRKAFTISARGFYHQRSGIELGPPYTTFRRPRCFHPDDGLKVYASTCGLMDSRNGLNALGNDPDNFTNLRKGKTDVIVPDAWGGYFDAGDWDRRIQHLYCSRLLLELADLFSTDSTDSTGGTGGTRSTGGTPGAAGALAARVGAREGPEGSQGRQGADGGERDYFAKVSLSIPESSNDIPDIIDEALFNLDCYRRMQREDGGIRGGIESAEHPRTGECSWQESLTVMAYAPCAWSSFIYAGDAARAAFVLRQRKPDLAAAYETSSLRAMEWAEKEWARLSAGGRAGAAGPIGAGGPTGGARAPASKMPHEVRDARNLAAAELFRLTGLPRWHDVFLDTTVFKDPKKELFEWQRHEQRDAAFTYAITRREGIDKQVQANARQAIFREADESAKWTETTAFGWCKLGPYAPVGWGSLSTPQAVNILRAYHLSGEPKYLAAAIRACQSGLGANPANTCYTTHVGHAWPRNPLVVDMINSAQPAPPGITIYGPFDMERNADDWAIKLFQHLLHPAARQWPSAEAHFDVHWLIMVSEFTVFQTMAPNAYVWGYLAARR